jgi:hypothetical protein
MSVQPARWVAAALLAALVVTPGCGNETGPTGSGEFEVSLVSPNTDGALVLTVRGGLSGQPRAAAAGVVVYARRISDSEWRVLAFGTITGGPLLRLTVPDVSAVEQYRVTVDEAAGIDNQVRPDLANYAAVCSPRGSSGN